MKRIKQLTVPPFLRILLTLVILILLGSPVYAMELDTDRPGMDYKTITPNAKFCEDECINDPKCKAWTYVKPGTIQGADANCWLKSEVPAPIKDKPCCISGFKSGSPPVSTQEPDTDRPGMDYKTITPNAKFCEDECINDPKCKAWTYVKPGTIQGPDANCWLKSGVPTAVKNKDTISGVKGALGLQKINFYMSDKKQSAMLTYEDVNGLAVFEGDIILGRSADLQKPRPRTSVPQCVGDICSSTQPLSVIFGETYLWPGGVIPFEIDPRLESQVRTAVGAGINMLNRATNLLVKPRNGERDYIVFVPSGDPRASSSSVGRQIGRQEVSLATGASADTVAHEVLHAAGAWHEQSRTDRDNYIKILWENIESGREHNFEMHASDGVDIGPYDPQSVMHYPGNAFGKKDPGTGQILRTIETIPPGGTVGGNRLSTNDVAGINQLYPASSTQRYVPIPNLVFGLRHSQNQSNDYIKPFVQFGQVVAQRIHGGDLGAPSGEGFSWWMIPTETPLSSLRMEEIPPGVVLGMWHSKNMNNIPGDFRLVSVRGGDLGAPSGEGFVWYENQSTAQVNWNVVDMLPPYTVVGLKHSQNQRNKTFQWKDGQTYDPLVSCPDGFDRKNGGDRGAPSGTGFYWCEKRLP